MKTKTTCEAIRDRLTLYLLDDLDPQTQATMARHLAQCDACRALADQLAPTLDLLRDALQEEMPDAPAALSPEHRQRVVAAFRQRAAGKTRTNTKRKPLLLRFHILEMAAVLIGALMIISLVTANFGSHRSANRVMVRVVEPEMMMEPAPMEQLDEIEMLEPPEPTEVQMGLSVDMPSLPTTTPAPESVTAVNGFGYYAVAPPPEPSSQPSPRSHSRFARTPAPKLSEALNVPVDTDSLASIAPAKPAAPVRPAEFDSVAIVKSPVIMGGMLASRSAGDRESASRRDTLGDDKDIPHEIVNGKGGSEDFHKRQNAPAASGPAPKEKAAQTAPVLEDVPVTGRLMASDEVLPAGVDRKRESTKRLEKKSRKDRANADYIALEREDRASANEELDGLRIKAEEMREIISELRGPIADTGSESTPVASRADDSVMPAAGTEVSYEVEREELKRVVQDLSGQIRDMRGQLSDLLAEETPDVFAPRFKAAGVNPLVAVAAQPFSTFSIDVDTASYTVSRNYMLGGHLPPPEAVRTEEFVNFFDYAYQPPVGRTFRVAAEIAPSRFGRGLHLLKLGVKGRRLGREEQRQASLTLLIDSSGSMNQPDRLGLVRTALGMLLDELAETDQVAIIQFDNRARLVLAHTPVAQRDKILNALGAIQCSGGTNLEAGLGQAYEQAAKAFISRGENRILLMSDGVVNLGETAADGIVTRIEANRRQGLYLSVFGFGMGIYDDAMLKELASKGNGAYAFIDSETEARRVFVDDLSATLNTIAEDVKIQIEFNPKRVNQYRQLGYEQRQLTKEQFRDDTVDAGEVGSGQSVTALYELSLADQPVAYPAQAQQMPQREAEDWLAIARVRYRRVDNGKIEEIEQRISASDLLPAFDAASSRFRLAAGVAAFAEILRGSPFVQGVAFDDVAAVLRPVALDLHLDPRIRELVQMVETAGGLAR